MTFGRWLLVNSFSIFLVTLFVLGYFYREDLQLEQAYQQLLKIDTQQVALTAKESVTQPQKPVQEKAIIEKPNKVTVTEDAQPGSTILSTLDAKPEHQEKNLNFAVKLADDLIPVQASISGPAPAVPDMDKRDVVNAATQDEMLQQARQAYWNKEYTLSIEIYSSLIGQNSENPDYRGELGNIYYAMNDYPNASDLFYQAAQLLISQNQTERAQLLVSPITAMNRELGSQLEHSIP